VGKWLAPNLGFFARQGVYEADTFRKGASGVKFKGIEGRVEK
jgi:hypothetical protein